MRTVLWSFWLTLCCAVLVFAQCNITSTSLPNAVLSTPYNQTLTHSAGAPASTWEIQNGKLPAGLSMSSAGVITGSPTNTGTSSFGVAYGGAYTTLSITVGGSGSCSITTSSLPNGTLGTAYGQSLTQLNCGSSSWLISSGALPGGLTLAPGTGVISGTPTATGTFNFTVTYGGASASYSITITGSTSCQITTTSLAGGQTGTAYTQGLTTAYCVASTWGVATGALPPGLAISGNNITGTPTTTGTYNFTLSYSTATSSPLSIVIAPGCSITTASLPNGVTGSAYSQSLAQTGCSSSNWQVSTGSLPAGLTLSPTGLISGTPTAAGTSSFTVTYGGASQALSITVTTSTTCRITTTSLGNGVVGNAYAGQIATANCATASFAITSGALPAGLNLDLVGGGISGTPTAAGTFNFSISYGTSAAQAFTIVIALPACVINTTSVPNGLVGSTYSQALSKGIGCTGSSWSISSGTLPAGLTLAPTSGIISGIPTAAGVSNFTVSYGTATSALSMTVTAPCTVLSAANGTGSVGNPYTQTLQQANCTASSWAIASGALPGGLTLAPSTGVISGTPTTNGNFSFTASYSGASQAFSITITGGPVCTITTTSLANGVSGTPYSQTATQTNCSSGTWGIASGALPVGLAIAPATGVLSGTPTTVGAYNFTLSYSTATSPPLAITISSGCVVTTTSLANGVTGAYYFQTLTASTCSGGTWAITSGTLPPGLSLNTATGVISGTPTAGGTYSFGIGIGGSSSSVSVTVTVPILVSANTCQTSVYSNISH